MAKTSSVHSVLPTFAGLICALLVIGIGVAFFLTDLPDQFGLREASAAVEELDQPADDSAVAISRQARTNLGIRSKAIMTGSYIKYVEIPGVITTWPGRTHIMVTSPLTGVINAIDVARGQQVDSGASLFSLRLTHQDLVKLQEEFLSQLGRRDVIEKEITRLTSIAQSGAVARKTLINRQYELDTLDAGLRAVRQSMLLHGLTEEQVSRIEQQRDLIREITIFAPEVHQDQSLHHDALPHAPSSDHEHIEGEFLVTQLDVHRGESVESGKTLVQLSDYRQLLIEGQAFQRDAYLLQNAVADDARLQAVLERSDEQREIIEDLNIVYIDHEVGRESRALAFYVGLENEIERERVQSDRHFVSWRFKPGQRLTLRLPTSTIDDVYVVPNEAVADEGPNRYVFIDRGDHFDRVAVTVVGRDSINTAIANDGALKPVQRIAITRAHQLQMAVKNSSGGPVDPHAGHNH
jgi:multidrug efflux pump subunit AcrA (membrane-fusion protein)